ncbi:MAG: outer membrane beta-barrel protein, partial [Pseudomonadota bacterium]
EPSRQGSGAGNTLFRGPLDPDTQDRPTIPRPSGRSGRSSARAPASAGDSARVTPDGRIVRPGEAGFDEAAEIREALFGEPPAVPRLDNDIDDDIDPDLREDFDDDLRLVDEVRTGPLARLAPFGRERATLPELGDDPFAIARRSAFDDPLADAFRPLGIRGGGFVFLPTITAATVVTDNVFATSGAAEADIGIALRPRLRIESDWSRHALSLDADVRSVTWSEFDSENVTEANLAARARLDLDRRTNIELDAAYRLSEEQRGSVEAVSGAIEEPEVETYEAGLTFNRRINRLVTRTRGAFTAERNGDAALVGGGIDLGADDDFDRIEVASRWTYETSPAFAAFVEGAYNWQQWVVPVTASGLGRDSSGYELRVGFLAEIGAAIDAEASVGYAEQHADDARLGTASTFLADADITWRPTSLTTVNLAAASELDTTSEAADLGTLNHRVALTVRHEFRRYAIGTLGVAFAREDFKRANIVEDEVTFQLGGEYLFSRHLAALANVEHTRFSSTQPDADYTANTVRIGMQLRR